MSVVITLNQVVEFPEDVVETIVAREDVSIEGETATAETRIYPIDSNVDGFKKYCILHSQRYTIEGRIFGRDFGSILRRFRISLFKKGKYAITIGAVRGTFSHMAFKRLRSGTYIKCEPIDIDLIDAIEKIIHNDSGITINSGWFSNLGLKNLQNALLQGDDVNNNALWKSFKETMGASLSNIELIVEDDDFSTGMVKISLSKRGFLYSKRNLSEEKCLEIAERITDILFQKS